VIESENGESSEDNELEKLLISIGGAAPGVSSDSEDGHFENLSAQALEDILSGKADEEAALDGTDHMSAPITFSEDSYTESPLLGNSSVK
jgi:hypothetical protein